MSNFTLGFIGVVWWIAILISFVMCIVTGDGWFVLLIIAIWAAATAFEAIDRKRRS